jgi:hypothetical protein
MAQPDLGEHGKIFEDQRFPRLFADLVFRTSIMQIKLARLGCPALHARRDDTRTIYESVEPLGHEAELVEAKGVEPLTSSLETRVLRAPLTGAKDVPAA